MRARGAERIGEARTPAAVDRDAARPAAVVVEDVAVRRQVQRERAEEAIRVGLARASRRSRSGPSAWACRARRRRRSKLRRDAAVAQDA